MKTIELANIWTDNFDVNEKHYYDNQQYIIYCLYTKDITHVNLSQNMKKEANI